MFPKVLHDLLSEKLGADAKVTIDGVEVNAIAAIVEFHKNADKFKTDNEAIIKERDKGKDKIKTLQTEVTTITTERDTLKVDNTKLTENQLSEEDKKKYLQIKEKGMDEKTEATLNALTEEVKTLTKKVVDAEKNTEDIAKKKAETDYKSAVTALDSEVQKALLGVQIEKPEDIKAAMAIITTDGLAKIEKKDDGTFEKIFITRKEDGSPLGTDLAGVAKHMAEKYQKFVSPSGKRGAGGNHNNDKGGGGSDKTPEYTSSQDVKSAGKDMMFPKKE